jgi:formylglycine-generating enzyme required for sulfatase activity
MPPQNSTANTRLRSLIEVALNLFQGPPLNLFCRNKDIKRTLLKQVQHDIFICLMVVTGAALVFNACLVSEKCYQNADCDSPKLCIEGECVFQCVKDADCGSGFACIENLCAPVQAATGLTCPADMASIADSFCIDKYEASKPDASAGLEGSDVSYARSVSGVIPWQVASNSFAATACAAAGKRLCSANEWSLACRGLQSTTYGYGNNYQPQTCNGIDTFGRQAYTLLPTGSLPGCNNGWGAYDLNGNLWEHVAVGNDQTVRGGAYNCSDSETLHRCDYVPGVWSPSARGFRCCLSAEAVTATTSPESIGDDGGQCLDDDDDTVSDDHEPIIDDDDDDYPPPVSCPDEMVEFSDYCMDRYEASRPDATASTVGSVTSQATSRVGVLPWFPITISTARAACSAAGKRLCSSGEWYLACSGGSGKSYTYGNSYNPLTCNGIDTFCRCDSFFCATADPCPYAHCFSTCGAAYGVRPTGSFSDCTDGSGIYDINGNVWEIVDSSDGNEHYRGGAYNCSNSELLHQCTYDATWNPSAKGFRCCMDKAE